MCSCVDSETSPTLSFQACVKRFRETSVRPFTTTRATLNFSAFAGEQEAGEHLDDVQKMLDVQYSTVLFVHLSLIVVYIYTLLEYNNPTFRRC